MDTNIIKMAKSMKKDLIMITNSYIAGTDIYGCILSIIHEGSDEQFVGSMAELDGKKNPDYYIGPDRTKVVITRLINQVYNITSSLHPIFSADNLKEDVSFNEALNKKMSDGAYVYKLNMQYPMYMFSSLHPVNKSDKISCNIYDLQDRQTYMAHFIICKPKYQIHEYIRYLYL